MSTRGRAAAGDGGLSEALRARRNINEFEVPAPGLFEAGLLRARNTVAIISQVFGRTVLLGLMWLLVGFLLTFGDSLGGVIGNPATHGLMLGLKGDACLCPRRRTRPSRPSSPASLRSS